MADNVNKNPFSDLNIHVCIQREKSTKKCVTAMKPILRNHPNVETMWGEHSIPSHKSNLSKHLKKNGRAQFHLFSHLQCSQYLINKKNLRSIFYFFI